MRLLRSFPVSYRLTGGTPLSTKFSVENNAVNGQAWSFLAAIESLPGVWKGSSYGSWDKLTQAWHEAMAQLNSALADVKGRVGNAGALYDTYEAQQTSDLD